MTAKARLGHQNVHSANRIARSRIRENPRARDRHCTVLPGCPFVADGVSAARLPLLNPVRPKEKARRPVAGAGLDARCS